MKRFYTIGFLLIVTIVLTSSIAPASKIYEFEYPKRSKTTITLHADNFKKFDKEWRGSDYYYYAESSEGIICSILYYKLTEEEQLSFVDAPKAAIGGPNLSPAYPYAYFSNYTQLKFYETNHASWGQPDDTFMFRQNDILEMHGVKFRQKHMYGYAMVDKDLFVNIHLSKVDYSTADSTAMRQVLASLTIKK